MTSLRKKESSTFQGDSPRTLVNGSQSTSYHPTYIYIYILFLLPPQKAHLPLPLFDYTLILLATKQISRPDLQSVLETSYFLSVCCLDFN
uniref:Uncharacterized protein n=1 Tax=Salix viminalis TaxID=40686 RepID=A0A6N2LE61_SALVM